MNIYSIFFKSTLVLDSSIQEEIKAELSIMSPMQRHKIESTFIRIAKREDKRILKTIFESANNTNVNHLIDSLSMADRTKLCLKLFVGITPPAG